MEQKTETRLKNHNSR